MKTLYLLVGIPGSGKSTYISKQIQNDPHKSVVFSSDAYRIKLFGSLSESQTTEQHLLVFETMMKDLFNCVKNGNETLLFYDATNLNRKKRAFLYSEFKRITKHEGSVVLVLLHVAPSKAIERQQHRPLDEQVPAERIWSMFALIDPPRISVDCDLIILPTSSQFFRGANLKELLETSSIDILLQHTSEEEIKTIIASNINQPHDTPYHLETISEHIELVVSNCFSEKDTIRLSALFHDLGKGYVKGRFGNKSGQMRYHEKIGSNLLLNYLLGLENEREAELLEAVEIVYQHMNAHQGLSEKTIRNYHLQTLQEDILLFAKYDMVSRFEEIELYQDYIQKKK